HLLGDRHLDIDAPCEISNGPGVVHPLRHLVHARHDVPEPLTPSEAKSDPAITGQVAGAGEDEIAETRQAGEGLPVGPEVNGEARDLRQTARDERRAAVVAEPESVAH